MLGEDAGLRPRPGLLRTRLRYSGEAAATQILVASGIFSTESTPKPIQKKPHSLAAGHNIHKCLSCLLGRQDPPQIP